MATRWRAAKAGLVALAVLVLSTSLALALEPCPDPVGGLVSVQGQIEISRAGEDLWRRADLADVVCPGDIVRAGRRSRAALTLVTGGVLRIDQHTSLRVLEVRPPRTSLLSLLDGVAHFLSRAPRSLEVSTPFLNAAVEGTEFVVRVDAERARVDVFSGHVLASNELGSTSLEGGEAVAAGADEAPREVLVLRPRDAVRWALHYPPVLALTEAPGPELVEALALHEAGETHAAIALLEAVPEAERTPELLAYRAALLLHVGRVDEAEADIAAALAEAPQAAAALALASVIALVRGETDAALARAREALAADPDSAAAHIAVSYAHQARFELEAARAVLREAVERRPDDPLAWARLAELELAHGERAAALAAAERASALAPNLARTRLVHGFAALGRVDTRAARAAFEEAIRLDSAEPLARLGLGLARIRDGELAAGRHELEIATSLDPGQALIRSYLGKAYFEERRDDLAAEELALAKDLDPADPTPWFYDAIRKQLRNRPVEALRDLEAAIAKNDNRAVYRSRLLLDEDQGARAARLGAIYRDLGFEQLALVQGWRSLERDPTNHSAHRLLADTYASLPRHEIARDSELLQAQLLQPLNLNPVQPRLASETLAILADAGPAEVGLNEFTRLFSADQLRAQASGLVGSQDTWGAGAIGYGIHKSASFSVGHERLETDGFRRNHDLTQSASNAFLQLDPTPTASVQAELRRLDDRSGDRALLFDPDNFFETRRDRSRVQSARLGLRYAFTPSATLIGSYSYRELDGRVAIEPFFRGLEEEKAHFLELRHLHQWPRLSLTAGFGVLDGRREDSFDIAGVPPFGERSDLRHVNGYGYANIFLPADLTLTLGASADDFEAARLARSQVNPKLGLTWSATADTVLRAAAFRTLKRTVISSQTLEPIQVAGFNQFFDDFNGTDAWRYGVGIDHRFSPSLHAGAEYAERDLSLPITVADPTPRIATFDGDEAFGRLYAYWTPSDRLAISAEYRLERFAQDPRATPFAFARTTTHKVPLEVRYFHPAGLFARGRVTFVDQTGVFEDLAGDLSPGDDRFWVADAGIGYRFPNRRGLASLEIRNLFDSGFRFQDSDPRNPTIVAERAVLARLLLSF